MFDIYVEGGVKLTKKFLKCKFFKRSGDDEVQEPVCDL